MTESATEADAADAERTEPQGINQKRNGEVQTILNVLKTPSRTCSDLARK